MGTLNRYQPTLGMSKEERISTAYTAKIIEWLHSVENLLTTVATITYTDAGCTLTPVFENINDKPITIEVSGTNIVFSNKTGNTSPAWESVSLSLNDDPYVYIVSSETGISIGMGTMPWLRGIYKGTKFDGSEIGIEISCDTYNIIWYTANGAKNGTSQGSGKEATGTTSSYCMRPFTFLASGILTDCVMMMDGGLAMPNPGSIYTINDETYIQMRANFALKV